MSDYPAPPVPANHVEPVPRRVRAFLGGRTIVDTTERPLRLGVARLPAVLHPARRRPPDVLVDEGTTEETPRGDVELFGLARRTTSTGPHAAKVLSAAKVDGLDDTVRFEWSAFDAWFEEDEQVFVHPRNPYTRVDALRSTRAPARRVQGRRPRRVVVAGHAASRPGSRPATT